MYKDVPYWIVTEWSWEHLIYIHMMSNFDDNFFYITWLIVHVCGSSAVKHWEDYLLL